jgi:hypothetical protein
MKHPLIQKFLPHVIAIVAAFILMLAYFNPMLSGKVLKQLDVDQWRASAEEISKFEVTGERTYWTGAVFSGMPTYLIAAAYNYNFTSDLHHFVGKVLPNPLDTVFLLFVCFYILMLSFEVTPMLAFIGAMAFTFSSFNFLNIDAGHVTKGHAIAYMPLVIAGIRITLYKNRWLGALITGIAMSLEVTANHLQITYYLLLMILVWMVVEIVYAIMKKQVAHLVICGVMLLVAAGIGIGTSATGLMATEEYGKYSIRGKSELTKTTSGESNSANSSSGLDKDYALQWSNGVAEPFTLLIPGFYGGGSSVELSTSSETYKVLKQNNIPNAKQIIQNMPLYWGTQPMTAGPVYYGAIVCFLFVLGLIIVKGNEKWWILGVSVLAIALSMGKNFMSLTDLFFYHFPLYNKFRSVTFILSITQLTFPLLGLLALRDIITQKVSTIEVKKAVKLSFYIVGGLCVIFMLVPEVFLSIFGIDKGEGIDSYFVSRADSQFPEWIKDTLIADRKSILQMDALRSLVLIAISGALVWMLTIGKLKQQYFMLAIAFLVVADLWQVDKRYLNDKDYQAKKKVTQAIFPKTQADEIILQDKDPNYRVYNTTQNLTQDAITSYYHKSIGGYHGAKLRRYQELIEFQIAKNNFEIFNMLNVKYFIVGDSSNNLYPQQNQAACGNAWFVPKYTIVANADAEIDSLTNIKPKQNVYIDKRYESQLQGVSNDFDSASSIQFVSYAPNKLVYQTQSAAAGVAVFSEIYYENGWNAYVDGTLTPHFCCDYVLRGMVIPAGKHTVEFKFEPAVVAVGEKISLVSSILLYGGLLTILGMMFLKKRQGNNQRV